MPRKYAIPKINMLYNLCCLKTRLRLPSNKYQQHSSLNLVSQQLKLCNIFIFGMAYPSTLLLRTARINLNILQNLLIVRHSHLMRRLPRAGISMAQLKLTTLPRRIVNELYLLPLGCSSTCSNHMYQAGDSHLLYRPF